jgi:hypothetical protein
MMALAWTKLDDSINAISDRADAGDDVLRLRIGILVGF